MRPNCVRLQGYGIASLADAGDPAAFPLRLEFNTPTASFTMSPLSSPVPEPSAIGVWLGFVGLALAGGANRLRRN